MKRTIANELTYALLSTFIVLFLNSCGISKNSNSKNQFDPVKLPSDLFNIPDTCLMPILEMLGDAKIIGVTEGTHGMNEPLDFRNTLIKYLVKVDRIDVIAFESGIIESRLVNDYINGKSVDLDSVLINGFSCTFGNFSQNKELILWLRDYNQSCKGKDRISFYGFDMAGCASNPELENSSLALQRALDYLQKIDPINFLEFENDLVPMISYLRLDNNAEDPALQYWDLGEERRKNLIFQIDKLVDLLVKNEQIYSDRSNKADFQWGHYSAICAKQNVSFIESFANPNLDYSVREKSMFENLEWILNREKGKRFLLFAHLSHLSKDIYVLNKDSVNVMPNKQFGEYLGEHYKDTYKVIGNFYRSLDYYDGIDEVKPNSFPMRLSNKYPLENFYLQLNVLDSFYAKPAIFGVPSSGGDVYMLPSTGIDIIFYTDTQHFYLKN